MNLRAAGAASLPILFLAVAHAADPVFTYDAEGAPIAAVADLGPVPLAKTSADARDRASCFRFLESIAPMLSMGPAAESFRIKAMDRESGRTHFRVGQYDQGIPIFGGEGRITLEEGERTRARYLGRFRRLDSPGASPRPSLSAAKALELGRAHLGLEAVFADPYAAGESPGLETDPVLTWYVPDAPGKSRARPAGRRLAWHLAVRANWLESWELVVDARDGSLLHKHPIHCAAGPATATAADLKGVKRTFGTWLGSDAKYYLIDAGRPMFDPARSVFPDRTVGALVTLDLANTKPASPSYGHLTTPDNAWNNPAAVSAHWHASVAYDYYLRVHGRNSIKGDGGTVRSFINAAGPGGVAMDNAYWNGHSMFYGSGNVLMTSMSGSLDVAGHELTHGVVAATANLRYRGQSGAINESMADIFGAMMDREDWKIGEDVVKPAWFKSGALRDMSNPNQGVAKGEQGWQPAHMNEYQDLPLTEAGDYGGVHANSGIPNKAFHLFATKVGKDKAEQVYYRALTRYLVPDSRFADLRLAVSQAAQDLYGAADAKAAEDAFAAVGVARPSDTVPKPDVLFPYNGPRQVLLTRAGPGDGNTLYVADALYANPKPLTRTPVRSRPSVSDDGTLALFVSGDGRLIRIRTDPLDARETVANASPIWAAAAISKDGRRWAAIKVARDTAIHVGDFTGGEIRKFPLFRPTGLGVRTATHAVALDWDHAGEYVLYDAYYRLPGTNGSSMEYRDVGALQVWDPKASRFGEGLAFNPFGDLVDGAAAANAVYSRNSPAVIAYEYSAPDGAISIRARNIATRAVGVIAATAMIGHPAFDPDDAALAFAARNGTDTVISLISLGPDKLSAAGTPRTVATGFKWPVPFAKGERREIASRLSPIPEAAAGPLKATWRPGQGLLLAWELPEAGSVEAALFTAEGRTLRSFTNALPAGRQAWRLASVPPARGLVWVRIRSGGLTWRAKAASAE